MPMNPCRNCLENNWSFYTEGDGVIIATCKNCEAEVSFLKKPSKNPKKPGTPTDAYKHQDPDDDGLPPW